MLPGPRVDRGAKLESRTSDTGALMPVSGGQDRDAGRGEKCWKYLVYQLTHDTTELDWRSALIQQGSTGAGGLRAPQVASCRIVTRVTSKFGRRRGGGPQAGAAPVVTASARCAVACSEPRAWLGAPGRGGTLSGVEQCAPQGNAGATSVFFESVRSP